MKPLAYLLFSILSFTSVLQAHDAYPVAKNEGQWDGDFSYRMQYGALSLFVQDSGFAVSLLDLEQLNAVHIAQDANNPSSNDSLIDGYAYFIDFVGGDFSNATPRDSSSFLTHYFLGNDSTQWRSNLRRYKELYFEDVWSNIDMRLFFSDDIGLKYEFIVKSGGDIEDIQLVYTNPNECLELVSGDLIIDCQFSQVIEEAPLTFLQSDSSVISSFYTLINDTLRFDVGAYPASETIILDPSIIVSSASGATGSNFGSTACPSPDGEIYTGNQQFGNTVPTNAGSFQTVYGAGNDISINKYNEDGTAHLWSSYLGGSQEDFPFSIISDANGSIYVLGYSASDNYPTAANAYETDYQGGNDYVLTRLSADGATLLGSTYYGGSGADGNLYSFSLYNSGHDRLKGELKIDSDGSVVCIATTHSDDIPLTTANSALSNVSNQNSAAVVFRFNSNFSALVNANIIAGSSPDAGFGLITDGDGKVYVCGSTVSSDFPVTLGTFNTSFSGTSGQSTNAWAARMSADLSTLEAATFLNTSENSSSGQIHNSGSYFIDFGGDFNSVYVYGLNLAGNLPSVGNGYLEGDRRVTVHKLSSDLNTLEQTIGLGGGFSIELGAFEVDVCDRILLSNYGSDNLDELDAIELPSTAAPVRRFYFAVLPSDGASLQFGSLFTGNHVDGGTSRFDSEGVIYHSICATSAQYYHSPDAVFGAGLTGGAYDGKFLKINLDINTDSLLIASDLESGDSICVNQIFTVSVDSATLLLVDTFSWYVNDIFVSNGEQITVEFDSVGWVNVRLDTDYDTCVTYINDELDIYGFPPTVNDDLDIQLQNLPDTVCPGESFTLEIPDDQKELVEVIRWNIGNQFFYLGDSVTVNIPVVGDYVITVEVLEMRQELIDVCELLGSNEIDIVVGTQSIEVPDPVVIECQNTADFNYNFPDGDVGYWTYTVPPGAIGDVTFDPDSFSSEFSIEVSDIGTYELIYHSECFDQFVQEVNFIEVTPQLDAAVDTIYCEFEFDLAEFGQVNSGAWEVVGPAGATITVEDDSASSTSVEVDAYGLYVATYTYDFCDASASKEVFILQRTPEIQTEPTTVICDSSIDLSVLSEVEGRWNVTGPGIVTFSDIDGLQTTATVGKKGTYVFTFESCEKLDSVEIIFENRDLNLLGPQFVQCGSSALIEASLPVASGVADYSIVSSTGNMNPILITNENGSVTLEVENYGTVRVVGEFCENSDTISIGFSCALEDLPNVFSPNKLGPNELFIIPRLSDEFYSSSNFTVLDRWGELVYHNGAYGFNGSWWNGINSTNNEPATEGVYFYILTVVNKFSQQEEVYRGTVTIFR